MTVYLDHAASTPLRPEVLAEMLPILEGDGANPSSPHGPGRRARRWLDEAHERLARSIGAEARGIIFTSGGTEAINLAVKGAAWAGKAAGHRILTTAVEHKAVLESCLLLEKYGFEVRRLAVDRYGRLDPDDLTAALTDKTILVSLQLANNEVGTIQPMAELVARVRAASPALIHVDAVQGAAHLPIDVEALGADLVSFAAHKVEGPKGVGALWIRRGTTILPQVHGGSQERYRRAGTENVAGAVGMAAAFELAAAERATTVAALAARRDRLRSTLLAVESRGAHRAPRRAAAGLVVGHRARRPRRRPRHGAGPGARGLLHGIGLHDGLQRTLARADGHGLPAMRRPALPCACRWAAAPVTTMSRSRSGSCRRPSRACAGPGAADMSAPRVLVAMSGGVDSSVAAALLVEEGLDVVGVWMRLHDGADAFSSTNRSCCSLDAADDARRVAGQLGIPFYVLDLEREFSAGVVRALRGRVPRGPHAEPVR